MKKIFTILTLLLAVLLLTACNSSIGEDTKTLAETMAKAIGVDLKEIVSTETIHGA